MGLVISEELRKHLDKAKHMIENPTLYSQTQALELFDKLGEVGRKEYMDYPELEDYVRRTRLCVMFAVENVQ